MPLIRSSSREAVSENIRREIAAKKPQRQAVAIALTTQREARRHGLAAGGAVERTQMDRNDSHIKGIAHLPKHGEDVHGPVPMRHRNKLGITNLQDNPQGVGRPSQQSKLANQQRKTW